MLGTKNVDRWRHMACVASALAQCWINFVFLIRALQLLLQLLFLSALVARAVEDALDQEVGIGGDDGGHADQDHPHPLPG